MAARKRATKPGPAPRSRARDTRRAPTCASCASWPGRRDLERAVADLAERLPQPLFALAGLAYNYRWSWTLGGESVFREIDPSLWRRCGGNPRALIEATPPHRLHRLAADAAYAERVERVGAAVASDLRRPPLAVIPRFSADRMIREYVATLYSEAPSAGVASSR